MKPTNRKKEFTKISWAPSFYFLRKSGVMNFEYKLCKLYLSITRFFISLSKIGEYHLGTHVRFRGVEYIVVHNANMRDKFGRIYELERAQKPRTVVKVLPIYARETELTKVVAFNNIWHDAMYWWKWYKKNWLMLDAMDMVANRTLSSVKILGRDRALGRK